MAVLRVICIAMLAAGPALAEVRFTGSVVAAEPVELRAAREGMLVAEVFVRSGDRVEAGAPLARLRDDEMRTALSAAEAALARAEAGVTVAEADIRIAESDARIAESQALRADHLSATGGMSVEIAETRGETRLRAKAQLARTRAALVVAQADVATAQADLDTARLHLADTYIRAPVPGLILARTAEVGIAAVDLFRMARDGTMIVEAQVLDRDFGQLRPGLPATIRLGDREVQGRVDSIGGSIDPATRLGLVRISLAAPEAIAGAFASGEILTGNGPIRESLLQ